jgi:hypothetical protein
VADVDGPRPVDPGADVVAVGLCPLSQIRQLLGRPHVGHVEGVLESRLVQLEAGGHVEDRLAVLDRDHPAGGERATVADPVDLIEDRHLGVAGPQEVCVERVDVALGVDGAGRRHQGLSRHLAAEDALAVLRRRHPAEDVDLDGLEVEHPHQFVDGSLGHARKGTGRAWAP